MERKSLIIAINTRLYNVIYKQWSFRFIILNLYSRAVFCRIIQISTICSSLGVQYLSRRKRKYINGTPLFYNYCHIKSGTKWLPRISNPKSEHLHRMSMLRYYTMTIEDRPTSAQYRPAFCWYEKTEQLMISKFRELLVFFAQSYNALQGPISIYYQTVRLLFHLNRFSNCTDAIYVQL